MTWRVWPPTAIGEQFARSRRRDIDELLEEVAQISRFANDGDYRLKAATLSRGHATWDATLIFRLRRYEAPALTEATVAAWLRVSENVTATASADQRSPDSP